MASHEQAAGVRAFIGLGGNLGDPRAAMRTALARLDADPLTRVVRVSSLYRTPPWGKTDQPDFLNAVAGLETRLSPRQLLHLCLGIEAGLHRVRTERWGPRSIDLDVLAYADLVIDEEGLRIPHPRIAERAFVLVPLAEIAPDFSIGGGKVRDLLANLDTAGITLAEGPDWWR